MATKRLVISQGLPVAWYVLPFCGKQSKARKGNKVGKFETMREGSKSLCWSGLCNRPAPPPPFAHTSFIHSITHFIDHCFIPTNKVNVVFVAFVKLCSSLSAY